MKSSAVSVSINPGPLGLDSVAIRPSGSPVLKLNGSATAGNGATITALVSAARNMNMKIEAAPRAVANVERVDLWNVVRNMTHSNARHFIPLRPIIVIHP